MNAKKIVKTEEASKELVVLDSNLLAADSRIGMDGVDKKDIRPPQILLVQKTSDATKMKNAEGLKPDPGQFFHSGRGQIMDEFECYIVYAAKSKYFDKRAFNKAKSDFELGNGQAPEEMKFWKDKYTVLGVLADDFSLFGMDFRSGAMYTLFPFFGRAISNKRPYWSLKIKITSEHFKGKFGEWETPIVTVIAAIQDMETYHQVKSFASQFEKMSVKDLEDKDEEDEIDKTRRELENAQAAPTEEELKNNKQEKVNPDDVPF